MVNHVNDRTSGPTKRSATGDRRAQEWSWMDREGGARQAWTPLSALRSAMFVTTEAEWGSVVMGQR